MKGNQAPIIVYICLLPILLALGIWQLNRAEEKRLLLELQKQQSTDTFVLSANSTGFSKSLLLKSASAVGRYDRDHQFLLDNQVNKGRVGYFVLTPFVLKDANKAILVNRGWVALGKNRAELPPINVDNVEITVAGRINHFPSVGFKLAGAEIPSAGWPAVVQVVDVIVLSKQLGYPLLDFQLELDKTAKNGFTREWQMPTTMTPEKHVAYAVQWFLLAITLTVLYIKFGFNRDND